MKKVLLTLALSIVNYQLSIAALPAVKLCRRIYVCTWQSNGAITVSGSCSGANCSCRATLKATGCSISGPSVSGGVFQEGGCQGTDCEKYHLLNCQAKCPGACSTCLSGTGSGGCTRAKLLTGGSSSSDAAVSSVTCPIKGVCANPDYKTVEDDDSCDAGWNETTAPALTISGTYSDDAGTFTYGACTS